MFISVLRMEFIVLQWMHVYMCVGAQEQGWMFMYIGVFIKGRDDIKSSPVALYLMFLRCGLSQSLNFPDLGRPAGFKDLSISALEMVGYRALLLWLVSLGQSQVFMMAWQTLCLLSSLPRLCAVIINEDLSRLIALLNIYVRNFAL